MASLITTRSQTRQAAAIQPPQDNYVTINWAFFDKSHPRNKPLPIEIPRQLFESSAFKCLDLFVTELLNYLEFRANRGSIRFWQVCGVYLPSWHIAHAYYESDSLRILSLFMMPMRKNGRKASKSSKIILQRFCFPCRSPWT